MKPCLVVAALLLTAASPQPSVGPPALPPIVVKLDGMPVGSLVTTLMRDVMGVPYVIAPDVLADRRMIGVNLEMPPADVPVRVVRFLRGIGLTVTLIDGTVYITKGNVSAVTASPASRYSPAEVQPVTASQIVQAEVPDRQAPQRVSPRLPMVTTGGASSPGPVALDVPGEMLIVEPAHRSPVELAEVLRSVLPGLQIATRGDVAASPATATVAPVFEPDRLVITGSPASLDRAAQLVRAIDKPRPVVEIRAVVFEVRTSKARGSALSILANLLGGKVQLGSYPDLAPGGQFVRIATGGLSAVLSAVKEDGRFNVVAEPSLAALSGATATINSGSQVPTLGAVSFSEGSGTPTRSIVYRDSGVSLTVSPVVRRGEIQLTVSQERSTFVRTTTGVEDSPTLNRSSSSASLAIAPGETIAMAGLDEKADTTNRRGLLGGLLGVRSSDQAQSQLLVLLQADLAQQAKRDALPVLTRLGAGDKPAS